MTGKELKELYFTFFRQYNHAIIPSASLIPELDPTVLFTTAGMHPLVPYLLGQKHPEGKRLANVQKCLRTVDIDEVGDETHLTFFEMLGNWSLGDYFKTEAIKMSYEFLTEDKWLGINPNTLSVTVFGGDEDAPRDEESAKIWQSLGIPPEKIYYLPKADNWWGPAGLTGPCGPCTEMFIDTGKEKCSPECIPGCNCGKWFEVWNDVFMEYNKTAEGKYVRLKQRNVDTGMGVERTVAMLQGRKNIFEIDTLRSLIEMVRQAAGITSPTPEQLVSLRIIVDHIRSATFILGDDQALVPSNVGQGYILRRLIRRGIRHKRSLNISEDILESLATQVISMFGEEYPELVRNKDFILNELAKEKEKFLRTLKQGLRKFTKFAESGTISLQDTFMLFQSYGFPLEMTQELAQERGIEIDIAGFWKLYEEHQNKSRAGAEKIFKGGLADASEQSKRYHTATHLLHQALRDVFGSHIKQEGSNITPERMRFDFSHTANLTKEEVAKIEKIVNEKIAEGLPVVREEMTLKEALDKGAIGLFQEKYEGRVSVYSIDNYSKEICGGPHVENTKELGHFKIIKKKSIGAGVRRVWTILEEEKKDGSKS
ncbi:MAG: alanine--tRNA ligase [Candidatus Hodarchaeota archaeon]